MHATLYHLCRKFAHTQSCLLQILLKLEQVVGLDLAVRKRLKNKIFYVRVAEGSRRQDAAHLWLMLGEIKF